MGRRLSVADDVAWIKYSNQLPVRDTGREAEVLGRRAALGAQAGLDPIDSAKFFALQIRASRAQQEGDIRRWRAGATLPAREPQSLRDDIRPKIDLIDRELISALERSGLPNDDLAAFAEIAFRRGGSSRAASRIAAAALR
jgi:chorismate mutase